MTPPDIIPGANAWIALRDVTEDNLEAVLQLKVADEQESFVAPNVVSIAQAYFNRYAWFRAIYADGTPVGFVMLYDNPDMPEYFLWRFMIDARYQGLGFGRQALEQVIDYVRGRPGVTELLVSHGEGDGNPGPFYQKLGFAYTGGRVGVERVMRLPVQPKASDAPRPLTHVVLLKLKDREVERITTAAARLRSLQGKIPQLREFEVGVNIVESSRAYDIALLARFASLTDMQAYQVHPAHQEVLAYIRTVADSTIAVDFYA